MMGSTLHRLLPLLMFALALAACGNPRRNPPANNPPPDNNSGNEQPQLTPRQAISLRPSSEVGERFRTTRTLRVEELTETERYLTESEEVTLTEVLRVDDAGRLMAARRTWESSVTRLIKGYGRGEEAEGELHACTLELTQRAGGVEAKVLVGDVSISGRNLLIEGFDTGLLPLDPVHEGDYWELQGSRLSGLNRFVEAMEFTVEKNALTCQLYEFTDKLARVSVEWRITGSFSEQPAVLEFDGELVFDRQARMITEFDLKGGRQAERGPKQQIEISIKRRPVDGWLDLEK